MKKQKVGQLEGNTTLWISVLYAYVYIICMNGVWVNVWSK